MSNDCCSNSGRSLVICQGRWARELHMRPWTVRMLWKGSERDCGNLLKGAKKPVSLSGIDKMNVNKCSIARELFNLRTNHSNLRLHFRWSPGTTLGRPGTQLSSATTVTRRNASWTPLHQLQYCRSTYCTLNRGLLESNIESGVLITHMSVTVSWLLSCLSAQCLLGEEEVDALHLQGRSMGFSHAAWWGENRVTPVLIRVDVAT